VAREALKDVVPDSSVNDIVAKVEEGHLTLDDLDDLGDLGATDLSGLSLVYGTNQPDEITLSFLCNQDRDQQLLAKAASADLKRLASEEYGADLGANEDIESTRSRLASYLLNVECLLSLKEGPSDLGGVTPPTNPTQQNAILRIITIWRNRLDLESSYHDHARRTEENLDLESLSGDLDLLDIAQTFRSIDHQMQTLIATVMRDSPTQTLLETARLRQGTFWGRQPESKKRWQLIAAAGELILESQRVQTEVPSVSDADQYVELYTNGDHPWCEVDTAHRRLERLFLEFEEIGSHTEVEKLVYRAQQAYQSMANELSESFITSLEDANYQLRALRQRDVFQTFIKSNLGSRTAYFLVDAMRYEMGRELSRLLHEEGDSDIYGAIASVPTSTEIGMASLLPGAEKEVEIIDAGGGKLSLMVEGEKLGTRAQRMAFLQKRTGVPTAVLKLEDFQPFRQPTRKQVSEASLIVVTSQEIDMVGEADNSPLARQTMENALDMLQRAVRLLKREGVECFVLTADHGHLFGDQTLSDMLLDKPGGGIEADLHRRCWVGNGGTVVPNTVRFKTSAFGLGGGLEIVTPKTLACFRAGGGNSFFHGGLSLQELVVPVVVVKSPVQAIVTPSAKLKLGGPKRATTRTYSASISAETAGLFETDRQIVRVELRAGGKKVGRILDADYGLEPETNEIVLQTNPDGRSIQENHVIFLIEELGGASELEVHLIDALSEKVLDKLENVEVAITL